MSQWSEFTSCSATCGVGVSHRTRQIFGHASKENKQQCPPNDGRFISQAIPCKVADCFDFKWQKEKWDECQVESSSVCGRGKALFIIVCSKLTMESTYKTINDFLLRTPSPPLLFDNVHVQLLCKFKKERGPNIRMCLILIQENKIVLCLVFNYPLKHDRTTATCNKNLAHSATVTFPAQMTAQFLIGQIGVRVTVTPIELERFKRTGKAARCFFKRRNVEAKSLLLGKFPLGVRAL